MTELTAKQQALNMELDELRDPQRLAVAAKELGMVAPSQPAFVRLPDGRILGNPARATPPTACGSTRRPPSRRRSTPSRSSSGSPATEGPTTTDPTNPRRHRRCVHDRHAPDGRKKARPMAASEQRIDTSTPPALRRATCVGPAMRASAWR